MSRDRLLRLSDYLERYLFEPLEIGDLAAQSALSTRSLQRCFSTQVGEGLVGYLRGRRLSRAAELLLNGHPDILTLALDCQFGSHEAFTRAFSRQFFMTPSEFRHSGTAFHCYRRPVLDEGALTELAAHAQAEPQRHWQPAQTLWGLQSPIGHGGPGSPEFAGTLTQLMDQLAYLFPRQPQRVLMSKEPSLATKPLMLTVATTAGTGAPPQGLTAFYLPANWQATFTLLGSVQQLPVFLYHCYAQWLFHRGWHHADAPIELHIPSSHCNDPFRFTLPVRPTPSPEYRLW